MPKDNENDIENEVDTVIGDNEEIVDDDDEQVDDDDDDDNDDEQEEKESDEEVDEDQEDDILDEEEEEEYEPPYIDENNDNSSSSSTSDSSSDSSSDNDLDNDNDAHTGTHKKINIIDMDSFIQEQMNDSDSDNENEDDTKYENESRKFNLIDINAYTQEHHQESLSFSMEEVYRLCILKKNSEGIIIDPLHRTLPFLTKYEKARIIGQRTKQIETGSKPLCEIPTNMIDSRYIAQMEFDLHLIPFIIRRPLPDGGSEFFHLQDLKDIYLS